MAVAHDGETILDDVTAASTSHSFGNKTTAGSDRLGIVHVRISAAAFSAGCTVTWDGNSMTEVGTGSGAIANAGGVRSFYIVNPPTASSAVAATTPGSTGLSFWVTSYNGVDQATPVDTGGVQAATGTTTTPTVTVTSVTDNMILSAVTAANTFSSNGSGQTQEGTELTDGGSYVARTSRQPGSDSSAMDYTLSGSANWATLAFELNAEAVAGGGSRPYLGLLGVS